MKRLSVIMSIIFLSLPALFASEEIDEITSKIEQAKQELVQAKRALGSMVNSHLLAGLYLQRHAELMRIAPYRPSMVVARSDCNMSIHNNDSLKKVDLKINELEKELANINDDDVLEKISANCLLADYYRSRGYIISTKANYRGELPE